MIYTFYSYKGGVGRSMALANVAELFYRAGRKVLVVDWDLEAPGLERYFAYLLEEALDKPGVIDMLLRYKQQMAHRSFIPENEDETLPFEKPSLFTINIYPNEPGKGQLLLLPAGQMHPQQQFAQYVQTVHEFDWVDFYENWEGELYFEWLREKFEEIADVILIDSRTGVTEMGGVCTDQLADVVVMFCTPNEQSFEGTYEMVQRLTQDKVYQLRGGRSLDILVIPARVEDRAEVEFLNEFRDRFMERFDQFLPEGLKNDLESFWELKIPHVPYYAFTEIVAVREHDQGGKKGRVGAEDMIKAFKRLTQVMAKLDPEPPLGEEAMNFYIATKAWAKAASLLDENYAFLKNLYTTGQTKALDEWFSKFPFSELEQHPQLLLWWGQVLNDDFGQPKRAMTFFNLAEDQFRQRDDAIGVAKAQIWQSVGYRMMGQANKAIELATQGLEQLKALAPENRFLIAWATRNRGLAYGTAGNIVQALADTRDALAQFQALSDDYMMGLCHHDIGVSLEKQAHLTEAEDHYRRAIAIWQKMGNENDLANSLIGLGQILSQIGRYNEALEKLNEGLNIALKNGIIRRAAFAQAGIGDAYFRQQAYQQAIKAYNVSTGYAQDAHVQSLEVINQIKLSECLYYLSEEQTLPEALEKTQQARKIAAENGLFFEEKLACLVQAKIHIRLREYIASFKLLDEAVAYFAENNAIEHVKAKLWWGYGLYLAKKEPMALKHLQEAAKLVSTIDKSKLLQGLGQTVVEVSKMLQHFLGREDSHAEKGILRLLLRLQNQPETSSQENHSPEN